MMRVSIPIRYAMTRMTFPAYPNHTLRNLRLICCGALLLTVLVTSIRAQDLPPCDQRATFVDPPWVDGRYWCLEEIIRDESAGELGFAALAAAPDGTLYAARPLYGQVLALTDADGDGLPESSRVIADGLTTPNGLAYHDEALYIVGGPHLYRWRAGELETLVADLPAGAGFWNGGITIGPDARVYVAIGAACDYCEQVDPARGAILSMKLDGSDRQVVATGLRNPGDVAFRDGMLWTLDTARDGLRDSPDLDELNRVEPGAFFGWPYCIGAANQPDTLSGDHDCTAASAPALTFPTHSTPLGLASYDSDTFPHILGALLVTLAGSSHQSYLEGYALAVVRFDENGTPSESQIIIPEKSVNWDYDKLDLQPTHYQGSGLWPRRPLDVTVSAEGWVYLSVGGGRILALRPR
jgi:glucose/arabinose dehydrogenase